MKDRKSRSPPSNTHNLRDTMHTSVHLPRLRRFGALALTLGVIAVATPAQAFGPFGFCPPGYAGAYLFDGTIESGEPGLPPFLTAGLGVQGVMTLHSDGTVVVRHNFGPPAQAIEPSLGAWKRTGPNQIKIVYLFFNVPRQTDPASTTPELGILIDRVTMHLERDHVFGILEGTLVNEVFLPTQDPLDPASVPIVAISGTVTNARRILP